MNAPPRVTIGLAVYNGENFLAEAVDSVLAQTYADFELIISDNASSDATEQLCREYAVRDARVSYIRQPRNRGAAWNQNEVMRLARGEFFKLMAHDDLIEPGFLERCVTALDAQPDCILAYTQANQMAKGDRSYLVHIHDPLDTSSARPSERFAQLMHGDLHGFRVFGLIRTQLLLHTDLFGNFHAADHIFTVQLALLGGFHHIEEKLLLIRRHPDQSVNLSFEPKKYIEWWSGKKTMLAFPTWRYTAELIRSVLNAPLPPEERRLCLRHIGHWIRLKRPLLATEIFKLRPQTPCWARPQ